MAGGGEVSALSVLYVVVVFPLASVPGRKKSFYSNYNEMGEVMDIIKKLYRRNTNVKF